MLEKERERRILGENGSYEGTLITQTSDEDSDCDLSALEESKNE